MLYVKRKSNNNAPGTAVAAPAEPAPTKPRTDAVRPQAAALYEVASTIAAERQTATAPILTPARETRLPVITGDAHLRGLLQIDGTISGQIQGSVGNLSVRQKSKALQGSIPELSGEITFVGMVRVSGHIAGTVYSKKGTLIVDSTARVDANVEVAVAVIGGTVNGDIVAHKSVELGPEAAIFGNIWTRSIVIKKGAVFEGVCRMIEDQP